MPDIGSAPNKTYQRSDGVRVGDQVWQEARDVPIKIRADAHDTHDTDVGDAIDNRLMRDGGNMPTADINWNAKRITNLAAPTARTDVARVDTIQDDSTHWGGTAGGTASALTVTLVPAITAYVVGMKIAFKASADSVGATTVNSNAVGALALKKAGTSDLGAGDLKAGRIYEGRYDGTNVQLPDDGFPSGTKLVFPQAAAPTGWTKDLTHNNKALRIVNTAGGTAAGSVPFTTAFASQTPTGTVGGTAISIAQMPAHTHPTAADLNDTDSSSGSGNFTYVEVRSAAGVTGSTGGGATHAHSFTGNAIDLAVQYVDTLICTKN